MARTKDTTSRRKRILQQQEISSAKKRVIIDPPSEDNKLVIDVCTSSSVKPNEPVFSQGRVRVVLLRNESIQTPLILLCLVKKKVMLSIFHCLNTRLLKRRGPESLSKSLKALVRKAKLM